MITTVTLNTAVDKLYIVEKIENDTVMRVKSVYNTAGGKGINVSKVAALAGEIVTATGFLGGFSGSFMRSMLESAGIRTLFTQIEAETRSCVNIRDESTGKHTEYLEPGASISTDDLDRFIADFKSVLVMSDIVSISGSVPKGTPTGFYSEIIGLCKSAGKRVIVDTSGDLLVESVKSFPTLIKPNIDEIEQLTGEKITSEKQIITAAQKIHADGIEYVAVSLGKDGSVFVCSDGVFKCTPPKIDAVNTVGCGDSMMAGFAVSLSRGFHVVEMLCYATAVSAANALELQTGHIDMGNLEHLIKQAIVRKLT